MNNVFAETEHVEIAEITAISASLGTLQMFINDPDLTEPIMQQWSITEPILGRSTFGRAFKKRFRAVIEFIQEGNQAEAFLSAWNFWGNNMETFQRIISADLRLRDSMPESYQYLGVAPAPPGS